MRWRGVILFVLLVLTSAMGLKNLVTRTASAAPSAIPFPVPSADRVMWQGAPDTALPAASEAAPGTVLLADVGSWSGAPTYSG